MILYDEWWWWIVNGTFCCSQSFLNSFFFYFWKNVLSLGTWACVIDMTNLVLIYSTDKTNESRESSTFTLPLHLNSIE